jgi:hypothetical protein
MIEKEVTARTRVRVTLEIHPSDRWGSDCTVEQAMRQGGESAVGLIERLIAGQPHIRIIESPKIEVVAFERST